MSTPTSPVKTLWFTDVVETPGIYRLYKDLAVIGIPRQQNKGK